MIISEISMALQYASMKYIGVNHEARFLSIFYSHILGSIHSNLRNLCFSTSNNETILGMGKLETFVSEICNTNTIFQDV